MRMTRGGCKGSTVDNKYNSNINSKFIMESEIDNVKQSEQQVPVQRVGQYLNTF
jgi:hypothetical protein